MAVYRSKDEHRELPWCADWYEGARRRKRYFATKKEAENCEAEHKKSMRNAGLPLMIDDYKKHIIRDVFKQYLDEKTAGKGSRKSETITLNRFLSNKNISAKPLIFYTRQDAYKYKDDRLKDTWNGKPITPRTVRREISSIRHVFEVAQEEWGMLPPNHRNPFDRLPIKGATHRRKRRLEVDELERLEASCRECKGLNLFYVPLAMYLAIETGMRPAEMFNLNWADIDIEKRRIEITKSKTDHMQEAAGRTIVMTEKALWIFIHIIWYLEDKKKMGGRVFPMTTSAFGQAWAEVVKRAGIVEAYLSRHPKASKDLANLRFGDLRHEAGSRFDAAGLSKGQHDLMLGHFARDTASPNHARRGAFSHL
jgi:integrase